MKQRKKIYPTPRRFRLETRIIQSAQEKKRFFLEVFSYTPENINQQKLGTLLAIFSIHSHDEDTESITNHLASVAKKEYFSKPNRPVAESFEAMLNRINLVLGEIAKAGVISWMGSLDGVICAISKDTLYFSTSGQGTLFLKRKDLLIHLSENEEEESTLHPLKTFEDIASGKILENDILILSERHLLEIFSPKALEKELQYLSFEEFAQMTRTALINQCSLAGAILTQIRKDTQPPTLTEKSSHKKTSDTLSQDINLFGKDAYTQRSKQPTQTASRSSIKNQDPPFASKEDYVDAKTGEIYVNQKTDSSYNKSPFQKKCEHWKECLVDVYDSLSFFIHTQKKQLRYRIRKNSSRKISRTNPLEDKEKVSKEFATDIPKTPQKPFTQKAQIFAKYAKKSLSGIVFVAKEQRDTLARSTKKLRLNKKTPFFLPNISRIKQLFKNFCYEQRIIAISILLFIVVTPIFFFLNPFNRETPLPTTPDPENTPEEILQKDIEESKTFWEEKWEQEKNVSFFKDISPLVFASSQAIQPDGELVNAFWWNNSLLLVQKEKIILYNTENKERSEFPFTESTSPIRLSTFMEDLSLLFFLTEEDVLYTFSPVSEEFETNTLPEIDITGISLIGSYLTYLYTLDKTNTLLRFPRAEGGFSEPSNWLEENEPFPQDTNFWHIQGSIYTSNNDTSLNVFFGGEKTDFSLEEPFIPLLSITSLFVTENEETLLILDNGEGRVLIVNTEDGSIQKNLVSEAFQGAKKILSGDNDFVYLLDKENALLRIPLNE
jgi:hypothetical protein